MGKVLIVLPDNLERVFKEEFCHKKGDMSRIATTAINNHLRRLWEAEQQRKIEAQKQNS